MADIKLFEPQRLTDADDGGGLMTANEVVDGAINNLFDDISRIDRVNGNVSLRKAFMLASTANTDKFNGAHVIVSEPPADDNVSGLLFKTTDWADVRQGAQDFVERYLAEGPISRLYVYDDQIVGQRTLLALQRPDLALPEIGEVFVLEDTSNGNKQYIRVRQVESEVQTFTDSEGDYKLRVISAELHGPLQFTFNGSQPTRYSAPSTTLVRRTTVADAAKYYSIHPLVEDADAGDLMVKVDSPFTQLVPSTQAEAPLADVSATVIEHRYATTNGPLTELFSSSGVSPMGATWSIGLGRAIKPGSLRATVQLHDGTTIIRIFKDNGDGTLSLEFQSGSITYQMYVTAIDYDTGVISGTNNLGQSTTQALKVEWEPVAVIGKSAQSHVIPVELNTRGFVYVATLRPIPEPGSLQVSFRSLGKWYTLQDDGTGQITGDAGTGGGTVSYSSGTVNVTLGGLPDVGSGVVFGWSASSEYVVLEDVADVKIPAVELELLAGNCKPGTLTITWAGGTKTASDNSAGLITGDATGAIVYANGELRFTPSLLPASDTVYQIEYEAATLEQELFNPVKSGGTITITLSEAPVRPKSIFLQYGVGDPSVGIALHDDGAGKLIGVGGAVLASSAINYATGVISFDPDTVLPQPTLEYAQLENFSLPSRTPSVTLGRFVSQFFSTKVVIAAGNAELTQPFINGTALTAFYKQDSAADTGQTEEVGQPALTFDLTPYVSSPVVPGSLLFSLGGRRYADRDGAIYGGFGISNPAGSTQGSIVYGQGKVTLTDWPAGIAPSFAIKGMLVEVRPLPIASVGFRTAGSPLRPGTFSIRAVRASDGVLISGLADNNGNIDTADMHGYIDIDTGLAHVAFGAFVLDSSLSAGDKAEPWYDVSNVEGDGYIWRPEEVLPGTIYYNAVVLTFLPLDPEILGLDPVRLPIDGRILTVRAGDTLVLHESLPYTMPNPLSAGQVVALPRAELAEVLLYAADGEVVPAAKYTVDLEAGEVTMATPLDLTGLAQPLVAIHRIEDMVLCTDVQITGQIAIATPLSRAYDKDTSWLSSALVLGNLQARYANLFEQQTWISGTPNWTDARIGSGTTAQYNETTYPIEVRNDNAISMRWALVFTSSTAFQIVGESIGVIGTGNTSTDVAPINPATGLPYFTMQSEGFGTGWATGNAIRFNTIAAGAPLWVARTVRSGAAEVLDDRLTVMLRWDKD